MLGSNSPVRRFAVEQFRDTSSGIWDYLDREALVQTLDRLVPERSKRPSLVGMLRSRRALFHEARLSSHAAADILDGRGSE